MNDTKPRNTDYAEAAGPGAMRIERLLPGPVERVWAYLTEADKRARWFAGGAFDLRQGGRIELVFDHAALSHEKETPAKWKGAEGYRSSGAITRFEPPRVLAFTWVAGDEHSEVTFELTPRGKDVLLVLTHRKLASRDEVVSVSGGWHAHLEVLRAVLEHRDPPGFWSLAARLDAEYQKRVPA